MIHADLNLFILGEVAPHVEKNEDFIRSFSNLSEEWVDQENDPDPLWYFFEGDGPMSAGEHLCWAHVGVNPKRSVPLSLLMHAMQQCVNQFEHVAGGYQVQANFDQFARRSFKLRTPLGEATRACLDCRGRGNFPELGEGAWSAKPVWISLESPKGRGCSADRLFEAVASRLEYEVRLVDRRVEPDSKMQLQISVREHSEMLYGRILRLCLDGCLHAGARGEIVITVKWD